MKGPFMRMNGAMRRMAAPFTEKMLPFVDIFARHLENFVP